MNYVTIGSSKLNKSKYSVQRGKCPVDRLALLLMWAKHVDVKKGDELYFRLVTEYWYRHEKDVGPPGPGSLRDYYDQINSNCFYDVNEIRNSIQFLTNDVIPSIEAYIKKHGPVKYMVDQFGGAYNFETYFEDNKGVFDMEPDLNPDELLDGGRSMKTMVEELVDVFQDALTTGNSYIVYYR